jgi:hypothetical protein
MEKETEQDAPKHHGIPTQTLVLESETSKTFIALIGEIEADLKPQTFVERILVSDFTANYWRQVRTRHMEKALMDYEISQYLPAVVDNPTKAALACRSASAGSGIFDLLGRFENRYAHNMAAVLRLLLQLRAARPVPSGALPDNSVQNRKENL